jgi:hypothetical protein
VNYSNDEHAQKRMRDTRKHSEGDAAMSDCAICKEPILDDDVSIVNASGDLVHMSCDLDMIDDNYDDCD